jgi:hypothetical protein
MVDEDDTPGCQFGVHQFEPTTNKQFLLCKDCKKIGEVKRRVCKIIREDDNFWYIISQGIGVKASREGDRIDFMTEEDYNENNQQS